MSEIQIYKKPKRREIKSKSHKIGKTILNLKWLGKLRNMVKKKIDTPIFIKKELEAEEMIENAKIHRQANRPLKKIKEFDGLTKFCQCCYNPMKDQIHVTDFNFCDSTDEFAEFSIGISLYFFYLKYACFILFTIFCVITIPNIMISKHITDEIINICEAIYSKEGNDLNTTVPHCNGFVNMRNDSFKYNDQILMLIKFNSMNVKQYRDIYFNITNGNDNINKVLFNYHFIYFIGLLTLFIVHSLYTILLFNIKKQYDMSVSSPSDYAVIITNLQSAFEILYSYINNYNQLIKDINNNPKNDLLKNNYISPKDDININSSRKIYYLLFRYNKIQVLP